MKIVHRVSLHVTGETGQELSRLGIEAREGLFTFEIDEADPRWPGLPRIIRELRAVDVVSTRFSPEELSAAKWLVMHPTWHQRYPQPEDDFGYQRLTYDLTHYCPHCGVGAVQRAPFRMKGEPRWGKYGVLQLNWVFDEFFARSEVWRETFEPFGIGSMLVVRHKTGDELKTVVQLKIATVAESRALLGGYPKSVCPHCGRTKYLPFVRGPFPPLESFPDGSAFRTMEYFGDGASAHRAIIVSNAVYRQVVKNKLKGIGFKAVEGP